MELLILPLNGEKGRERKEERKKEGRKRRKEREQREEEEEKEEVGEKDGSRRRRSEVEGSLGSGIVWVSGSALGTAKSFSWSLRPKLGPHSNS